MPQYRATLVPMGSALMSEGAHAECCSSWSGLLSVCLTVWALVGSIRFLLPQAVARDRD